jgi:hypothetical protein
MILSDHRKENEECYQYFRKLILERLIDLKNMRNDFFIYVKLSLRKSHKKRSLK